MNPALRVELYAPGDCLLFGDDSAETYVNFLADSLEKLWSPGKSQNSEARPGGRNNETRGVLRCCTRLLASSSGSLGARQPRIDVRTFTLREIASWLIWGVSTEWTPSRHSSFVSETAESGHCQRYVA